jgi:sulfate adenylyltransferase
MLTVELLLTGALAPRAGFTREEPLAVAMDAGPGSTLALRDDEGATVAALDVTDAWSDGDSRLVAGELRPVEGVTHHDFRAHRLTPDDVRKLAADRGWTRLLAYQPTHVVTQEQVDALIAQARELSAPLLLQPLHGAHQVGDLEWYARARSAVLVAGVLEEDLGADSFVLALTPNPNDAAASARIARNYGATHLAIDGDPPPDTAGLTVVKLPAARMATLPPAVAAELAALRPPPVRVGLTLFFTGFSGSGKSTVAKAVAARLLEIGPRRVTLLDGDVVRRNLSSELTFSREHRDLNIRRIGYVAAEVTRHGGVAICAPIAPYDETRKAVRAMVEQYGVFVLVHVATPLDVCEARDRKGLYARARAGDLPAFTGISDPYETPDDAELVLDTTEGTANDAAEQVLAYLRTRGYLDR